jgi:hypothetical protein
VIPAIIAALLLGVFIFFWLLLPRLARLPRDGSTR